MSRLIAVRPDGTFAPARTGGGRVAPLGDLSGPTWVYYLTDAAGLLVYVGIAVDPSARIRCHRAAPWWPDVDVQLCELYRTRHQALVAEAWAIRQWKPRGNRQHREHLLRERLPRPITEPVVRWPEAAHA